jgi:very-short-patch-repair endonuclease
VNAAAADVLRATLSGPRAELTRQITELDSAVASLGRLALAVPVPKHGPTELERWLFAALDADGVNYEPYAPVGQYVADALLPDHAVIIEADGVRWHRKREARGRERDADLAAAGYTVIHFTDLEMTSQRKACALVAEALASIRAGRREYRAPLLYRDAADEAAALTEPGTRGGRQPSHP